MAFGNLDATCGWGFAGDYLEAMYLTVRADTPDDFVIATGESHPVREFCDEAFARVGLDYRTYVEQDRRLLRPVGITETRGAA